MRKQCVILCLSAVLVLGISVATAQDEPSQALIDEGRGLFFTETFDGNGRTCATCHRAERSFSLDPAFIATLPDDDPLFVAEFTPALEELEDRTLLRERGLIAVNVNGFDQAPAFRAPPPLFNLVHTTPFGLNGDTPSLRDFTTAAIRQHFTQMPERVEGRDFRLPIAAELDALDAFMLSLILPPDEDFSLDRLVRTAPQQRGRELFFGDLAKCSQCHGLPVLSTASAELGGGNQAFDTGVNVLEPNAMLQTIESGRAFSTPQLFGVRHTGPFFHNNVFDTLLEAVTFYNNEFNDSPAATEVGTIFLASNEVDDIVAFLEGLTCPADGDVNDDGTLTFDDTLLILQHFLGQAGLDTCAQDRGDVDLPGNGLTPADALCIFQAALGLPSCLEAPASVIPQSCNPTCTGQVGENITLDAQVTNPSGEALRDVEVQFRLESDILGTVMTDAAGNVSMPFTRVTPGVFLVTATAAKAAARFNVMLEGVEDFLVTPLPCACVGAVGEAITIGVRITGVFDTPLAGILVEYRVDNELISRNVTDADGRFTVLFVRGEPGEFIVTATVGSIIVPFYVVIGEREAIPAEPVADAGVDQVHTLGTGATTIEVTLDGSRSSASTAIAGYDWSGTPNPADIVNPMVTLRAGVHMFTLTVTDTDGIRSPADTVTITVDAIPIEDRDGDNVPDSVEITLDLNPGNTDTDGNGVFDGEEDADNDGLSNAGEVILGSNPAVADSNANGVPDGEEDTDNDGLLDGEEIRQGTNPFAQDSDNDSWPDGVEIDEGTNPLDDTSRPQLLFVALPSSTVVLPGTSSANGMPFNTTVATPPASVVSPGQGDTPDTIRNTTLATPPVSVRLQP